MTARRQPARHRLSVGLGVLLLAGSAVLHAAPEDFRFQGSQPQGSGDGSPIEIDHVFLPPHGSESYGLPCVQCHDVGNAEPITPWHGSMMAQSARDPLFYAQLDLAVADGAVRPSVDGMADMCLRCHSPVGWLEGRSTDLTGMGFIEKDLFGVQCHFCHRLADPIQGPGDLDWDLFLADFDAAGMLPSSYGNGLFVVDPKQTRRGPYSESQLTYSEHQADFVDSLADWNAVTIGVGDSEFHPTFDSEFHRSGNMCGTCHNVSNPTDCDSGGGEDVEACFPIERTWTEWQHSKYSTMGEAGSCQSCHMSGPHNGIGFGAACEQGSSTSHINDVHFHDLTGGNTWVPQVILYLKQVYDDCVDVGASCAGTDLSIKQAIDGLYPPAGSSPFTNVFEEPLQEGIERARRTLRRSAKLEVIGTSSTLDLRLTNLTGHKLPTGYPEGRRMWMNTRFLAGDGSLLAESGEYDGADAELYHDQNVDPGSADLPHDVAFYTDGSGTGTPAPEPGRPTKVWEARAHWDKSDCVAADPADCPREFHFVLNNEVVMDNRIPPEGWDPIAYSDNRASPVIPPAYTSASLQSDYMDGGSPVHWDDFSYPLPAGADRARVTLYYQTASKEYIDALVADNPNTLTSGGYNRATLLQHAWEQTGRSTPVRILTRMQAIVDADGNELSDGWESSYGLGDSGCADASYNGDPDGDGLANWQEFQIDSAATPADPCDAVTPSTGEPRDPVNIVLVLDVSGSMDDPAPVSGEPKIEVLRKSVELFLETWKDHAIPQDRIGVVFFGTEAEYFDGIHLHSFVDRWEDVRDAVNTRAPDGWTAMGAGLHRAMAPLKDPVTNELDFDPADPRKTHLILFSNGMQNRSPMLVPDIEFPEFLVVRDQTGDDNSDVTGDSNVVIGEGLYSAFPIHADNPHKILHVHTVGIGVVENSGGDAWHALLAKLANQQYGKHNFITDSKQLEGVFLEDLVESLKGNTLEMVLEQEVTLADQVAEISMPVNPTASKMSIVLSWDKGHRVPPAMELLRPDNGEAPLDLITRTGSDWAVITRYFDPRVGDPGEIGTWTLRLSHPGNKPDTDLAASAALVDREAAANLQPMPVRVYGLLDDRELKYDFRVPRDLSVGEDFLVHAVSTEAGEVLKWMDEVSVTLERPSASLSELLADTSVNLDQSIPVHADARTLPFQRKLLLALRDPEFIQSVDYHTATHQLVDDGTRGDSAAGDGRFALKLDTPTVPGNYVATFQIKGHTLSGHPFHRRETHSVFVSIGEVAPAETGVVKRRDGVQTNIHFTPVDTAGNRLGPGYGSQILVISDGRELAVIDNLDGSYEVHWPDDLDPQTPVRVSVGGDVFHEGPVPEDERKDWWFWFLLLLVILSAILLLLWLVLRAARNRP